MLRVAGPAPRDWLLGDRNPRRGVAAPPPGVFSQFTSASRLLDPEHGASRGQRRELLGISRHTIQRPEEPYAVRYPVRELPQNRAALLDWQLDEAHPLFSMAVGEHTPPGHPRVLDPVGLLQAGDSVAPAVYH